MKRLVCLVMGGMLLALLMSSPATAEMAELKVGKGTLKIGGILQTGFHFHVQDSAFTGNFDYTDPENPVPVMGEVAVRDQFTLNRARLLFWGTVVPDKVKYFLQLEHRGGVGLLDFKAIFPGIIPKTTICAGRFLPNFTLMMPYHTGKLEMINYPVTTGKYAMWRQTGIQTTTTTEMVDFNVGVFNGADIKNNLSDNNEAKDILVRADFKPPIEGATVRVGGFGWLGKAEAPTWTGKVADGDDEICTLDTNRFGGYAKADYPMDEMTLKFRAELVMGADDYLVAADKTETLDSQAFFVQGGVQVNPEWEFLARFESADPNTDSEAKDDSNSWLTVGANYYYEGINAMFYLNYIHTIYEHSAVDAEGRILAQAQIVF
ncbi:hypothetical protein ACFL6M_00175 [Candidatus Eisenbacteria bacterium]|uniref:Porin n=1 Tax=Eiseniibacteriota bacterium TaxID=2212470 RepID=A0ABV6YI25_UNCEI